MNKRNLEKAPIAGAWKSLCLFFSTIYHVSNNSIDLRLYYELIFIRELRKP